MKSTRHESRPGADHRELYLIIVGLICGLLLGPQVLGRVSYCTYVRLFVAGSEGLAQLDELDRLATDYEQILNDATPAAWQEKRDQINADRESVAARHLERLRALLSALVLAVVAVMLMEALPWAFARLAAARYALLAVWIAITMAQPRLLRGTSALFVLLLIAMVLFASHVRLGRRPVPTANE